jgi:diacylglycerol O-acyltransferase
VVAGGLRRWLRSRGVRTEGLELRALVPVSIRAADERGHMGNRLAAMRGPLPVYVEDPVARLQVVRAAMDGLKESKQAVGAEVLAGVQNLAPPTILAQASRINFSTRLFNLLVTNVPGPQFPLYALGRELQDLFPVAFLPRDHALAVAIMSYNGGMDFGLLGDYDAMPDLDAVGGMFEQAHDELVAAARAQRSNGRGGGEAGHGRPDGGRRSQNGGPDARRGTNTPKRTSRPRTSSPASTEA